MENAPLDAASDALEMAAELRMLFSRLARRLRGSPKAGDITASQKSVLSRLETGGPATKSDLARAEGISPQSMGVVIDTLEAADLVVGTPDESDGRKTLYLLSGTAMERYATGRLAREDWLFRAISDELSAAEQLRLSECLPLLRRLARTD